MSTLVFITAFITSCISCLVTFHVACFGVCLLAGRGLIAVGFEERGTYSELSCLLLNFLVSHSLDIFVCNGLNVFVDCLKIFFFFFLAGSFMVICHFFFKGIMANRVMLAFGRVDKGMITILHPSVTLAATHPSLTSSLFNGFDLQVEIPSIAFINRVLVVLGVSAVILEVVGVGTVAAIMAE